MRTKFLVALFAVFCLWSCQDWGEMDPPAGNQQKPTLKELASYTFDDLGSDVSIGVYQGGKAPKLVVDKQLEVVLELDGGYVSYSNPLQFYTLQEAASLTGWVKLNESDEDTPIFCFSDETGSKKLMFTANSDLYYNEEKLNTNSLLLTAGEWHWFSVAVKPDSYAIYIDGVAVDGTITNDESVATVSRAVASGEVMNFMTEASKLYFGYGSKEKPVKMWIDEVSVYKNLITDKEIAKPELPDVDNPDEGGGEETLTPVYFNDFEGNNEGCTIKGDGRFIDEGDVWGKVYQNGGGAQRTHYLLLPEDALSHSVESKAMTIGVWVNAKNTAESYNFAPLFMAYGAAPSGNTNTWPMFACQYRGLLQVNCAGWSNFANEQNVAGVNTEYNEMAGLDWLADDEWHYYSVVLTETNAKVYFDGEIKNEWNVSGVGDGNVIAGLFSNGADLKYICLGGNQAWDWADNDAAFMFDDIAIYNQALTTEQIKSIIDTKKSEDSSNILSEAVAYYPLAGTYENIVNHLSTATGKCNGTGLNPEFVDETVRGSVLHLFGNAVNNESYVEMQNPLNGEENLEGTTISVWINRLDDAWLFDGIWAFYDTDNSDGIDGRLYFAPNAYLGFNATGGIFDVNLPDTNRGGVVTGAISPNTWVLTTIVLSGTGFEIYLNGELKYNQDNPNNWIGDLTASTFDYGHVMNLIRSCEKFYLGYGSWWGPPNIYISDLSIFNRALTASEVVELYEITKK